MTSELTPYQKEERKKWLMKRIEETESLLMHYKNSLKELEGD